MKDNNIYLLVLAPYMKILSYGLCQELQYHAINIHHSFLPSLKSLALPPTKPILEALKSLVQQLIM